VFRKPKVRTQTKIQKVPDFLNIRLTLQRVTKYDAVHDGCGLYKQIVGYEATAATDTYSFENYSSAKCFDLDATTAIETALGAFLDKAEKSANG
jgi:hypothetical protein